MRADGKKYWGQDLHVLTRQIEDVRNVRSEDSDVAKKKGNKRRIQKRGKQS